MTGARPVRLFLGGDVMTGRGIDQILAHPSGPVLYEDWVTDAREYVRLAERVSGPIPRGVADDYVWGDLLADLDALAPDLRIVNLETAVTTADRPAPKGINYRMNPANAGVLEAARLDLCLLANNHVLDWGADGLLETLKTLRASGIAFAGAGRTEAEAWAPAILPVAPGRRVIVLACASADSGVPEDWAAGPARSGVALLPDQPEATVEALAARLAELREPGDVLLVSIHWGGNWGYEIPDRQRHLAHRLIERCGADVVFGHSSHHPKALERHAGRLILYGAGDLLNDYEGIGGRETYPTHMALGYVVDVDPGGETPVACRMRPYEIRRFRLAHARPAEAARLAEILERECARTGTPLAREDNGDLTLATL